MYNFGIHHGVIKYFIRIQITITNLNLTEKNHMGKKRTVGKYEINK